MSEHLLLTVEAAAERIQIGRTRFYELMDSGAIESVHIGRSRRIPVEALTSYVNSLRTESAAA
jgi:excisionase family DNA binding protein